jgi:glycosyltransferase involved in cell wall biosynthesis
VAVSNPHRVALVHDWLLTYRGGEKVLEALCELYPHAEIFTLFHRKGSVGKIIERHPIHTSELSRLPGADKYYRFLLPLFPQAIERFDLTDFDLVISTSHCVAKGVLVGPNSLHVCYCLTPMRYAWDKSRDYFPKLHGAVSPVLHYLRLWDAASANRADLFVTLSDWVRGRIQKYYRRNAEVVYPFVDLETYRPDPDVTDGEYYLAAGAFAPYKRVDLAIEACRRLKRPLWIVGGGQSAAKWKALSRGADVRFLGNISDDELRRVYSGAKALLFPGEEDFGITPLESMACGKPVIAYGVGGATETVIDGVTGLHFAPQTVDGLCEAMLEFEKHRSRFTPEACRRQAEKFTKDRFKRGFVRVVNGLQQGKRLELERTETAHGELSPGNA